MRSSIRTLEHVRKTQRDHHADVEVPDFPRIEKVAKFFLQHPPGKLLDVGHSRGSFGDELSRKGWECIGLDLASPKNSKIRTVRCDLNEGFPIDSEAFDVVTAGEVIEHMLNEELFLQECRRVLKKDGVLVLTTPNLAFSLNRVLVLIGRTPLFVTAPYHYHFHTRSTLKRMVERCGFQVVRIVSSHVLYSRRRHFTGKFFEWLGDLFPTFGAHLILFAKKC